MKISILSLFLMLYSSLLFSANIRGKVYDKSNNDPLPGATIIIDGTNRGVATDLRGEFLISDVSPGEYKLRISYIGYEQKVEEISVSDDRLTIIEIGLAVTSITGAEVVVTAQAAGQRAAINQQVSSNSLTNVVSAQRIQEIPESSAADAVGRLPGVSLKGGSIVVRGLSPHYNQVQVDGVDMASTSASDRSSSLDMISQFMLEGIEMTKSAMADQDADIIGARVNLLIKEAPRGANVEAVFQNSYNTLSQSFGNQRFSLSGSNRFFDNRFGLFAQVSYDRNNWARNAMNAAYNVTSQIDADDKPTLGFTSLTETQGKLIGRQGFSLVMDYNAGLTKIKSSNFISGSESETRTHVLSYGLRGLHEGRSFSLNKSNVIVATNTLRIDQVLGRFEIDARVNHAYSENIRPENLSVGGLDQRALNYRLSVDSALVERHPLEIPQFFNINLEEAFLQDFNYSNSATKERQYSADINVKTNIKLGNFINVDLKAGGRYRHIMKENDREHHLVRTHQAYFLRTRDVTHEYIDWLPQGPAQGSPQGGNVGMRYFIDADYYNDIFLLGNYVIENILNEQRILEFHDFLWANPMGFELGSGKPYYKNWKESFSNDYSGYEDYLAAYIMPTISIGENNIFTLIPGLRYENNKTSYTGYRLPQDRNIDRESPCPEYADFFVTRRRANEFLLPMLHLILRPTSWMVIKSSYTHTLSRPQFINLVPSWNIGIESINWNNPYLEPALSKNLDFNVSLHGSKIGLFSVGVFQKSIADLIFQRGETQILQEDLDSGFYDGLENMNELTLVNAAGFKINYPINNPRESYLKGLEIEYQSNFYFLPGILKGLVLNANYTLFDSEARYPNTKRVLDFETFRYTYVDTLYVARLLDQAKHIYNIMLGFDYKDFSIRGSLKYTDNLFTGNSFTPQMRSDTDKQVQLDASVKQGFPRSGLAVYFNVTNILQSSYVVLNRGTGYPTHESYGAIGFELGLRYRFEQ